MPSPKEPRAVAFARRVAAGLADLLILALVGAVELAAGALLLDLRFPPPAFVPLAAFLLLAALVLLVLAPFVWGTTPGMALADLRIRAEDGGSPTLAAAFLRFVGFLLTGALAGVPLLVAAFDRRGRTLADLVSRTTIEPVEARRALRPLVGSAVRLALCQIDTTVGDFAGNTARIVEGLARAEDARADLAVFPELAVCGYPPRDLLERPSFVREAARALSSLARRARRTALLVGTFVTNRSRVGKPFHNVAALLDGGRVRALAKKTLLPTYDVFDEGRWFEPGDGCVVVPFRGERLGLPVCEDLWNDKDFWRQRRLYRDDPGEALVERGATLVVAISASPFSEGKPRLRRRMLARYARDGRVPVASLNLVGGNDELVFDGGSMVLDGRGRVAARAALFEEDFLVVDVLRDGRGLARVVPVSGAKARDLPDDAGGDPLESLRRALVLGIRDYARKCGFSTAVLGLSGGIDSALVAALAVEALGRENVTGLAMPSPYSSEGSIADARALAQNLGIRFDVLPIDPLFDDARRTLAPLFGGLAGGRHRGERPVAPPRHAPHGGLEQEGASRPHDRQQERARRGLLHALRRHVRRARPDLGPSEDARLRARAASQRARRRRAHPGGVAHEGALGRASAGADRPGFSSAVPASRRDSRESRGAESLRRRPPRGERMLRSLS